MRTEYKFKSVHSCEAVVLTCIDFRFWKETVAYIENDLGITSFDFPSLPGAAKAINESQGENSLAMQCVSVPCDLHHVKKIVLVNHQDCGAYGGSGKFEGDQAAEQSFHAEELKKAKLKLMGKYPDKEYILVFAKLDETKDNIEFLTIE